MPFGLCNPPAIFQYFMEGVLVGLLREKRLVYLDNILVMGTIFLAHLENLCAVFFLCLH